MTERSLTDMAGLAARHRAEKRFRWYGIIAITISLGFLAVMVVSIGSRGIGAFSQTRIALSIHFDEAIVDPLGKRNTAELSRSNTNALIRASLNELFGQVQLPSERRALYALVSIGGAYELQAALEKRPNLVGQTKTMWLTASDDVDIFVKKGINPALDPALRRLKPNQISWLESLQQQGQLQRKFNTSFFTNGDSREPEMAGFLGALVGSALSLLVCFAISFPIGVLSAVYLQEYAKKGRLSRIIEVNINNLAAVPSIVFGLLGLFIFINILHLPRSTPLVGGLVLALMTLPTIIIASRAALRAVPPSIREAAIGLGASKTQTTFHHVVPLAMPGMLTGTIIGMAQALGETAPLLMIGMVAFVVDIPTGILETATSLPVQIFLWADSPERAFVERTAAAIMVLLSFLVVMNLAAVLLRRRLERRW
ncbi:MAG: phosphate ABC transporter permease PstA [Robiginitomaculum sp.]|nr:phosphate ABC transporter permease PstA [Robiginitomaculum sp.]